MRTAPVKSKGLPLKGKIEGLLAEVPACKPGNFPGHSNRYTYGEPATTKEIDRTLTLNLVPQMNVLLKTKENGTELT